MQPLELIAAAIFSFYFLIIFLTILLWILSSYIKPLKATNNETNVFYILPTAFFKEKKFYIFFFKRVLKFWVKFG